MNGGWENRSGDRDVGAEVQGSDILFMKFNLPDFVSRLIWVTFTPAHFNTLGKGLSFLKSLKLVSH